MPKPCIDPGCKYPQWGGKYCRNHQHKRKDNAKKRIAFYSKPRTEVNKTYNLRARLFRLENPFCVLRIPGICTGLTQGVNHIEGKATTELLLDESKWVPACNPCNLAIEREYYSWAVEHGFRKANYTSKLSKFKR